MGCRASTGWEETSLWKGHYWGQKLAAKQTASQVARGNEAVLLGHRSGESALLEKEGHRMICTVPISVGENNGDRFGWGS